MKGRYEVSRRLKLNFALAATALMLTGCEQESRPEPQPAEPEQADIVPEVTVEVVPTNSILRPDMDIRSIDDPPMEPLQVTVPFADGGYGLSDEAKGVIERIAASDQFREHGPITLRGHTDASGSDDANLRVSRKRAQAVANALEKAGATIDNITIIGMGEQNPTAPNALPDGSADDVGRAKNRRVDVTIAPPAVKTPHEQSEPEGTEGEPPHPDAPIR